MLIAVVVTAWVLAARSLAMVLGRAVVWLGPRLRRTDVRDRQRWHAPRTLPGQRTPGEDPDGRHGGRGAA